MTALLALLLTLAAHAEPDFLTWAEALPVDVDVPAPAAAYRSGAQVFREAAALVRERPGVVTPEAIGTTLAGAPIWAFHVRAPGREVTQSTLIFANIHALEWISTEVAADLLQELAYAPRPGHAVTLVPILNPDGRAKVERDLLEGRNAYRRGNLVNVDLNRDFAHHRDTDAIWRAVLPSYYATSPEPLSQPESRALDALAARERYDRAVSLHAFGGFFYSPWAGRFARPEDHAEHVETGRAMEAAQGAGAYKTRQLARWGFFFRALGTELDHLYGEYGTETWLIELTRSGLRPLHPGEWKTRFRWYNPVRPMRHRELGTDALRALLARDPPSGGAVDDERDGAVVAQ